MCFEIVSKDKMKVGDTKINLAYISPVNPIPNGLSDYSEALLPALSEFADITLYSDCGAPSNPLIAERFVTRPVSSLPRYRAEHDLRLYQIGNSQDHRNAFDNLRWLPGVVTLHEPFLHHGFLSISLTRYRREVLYELETSDESKVERLVALTMKDDRAQLLAIPLIGRVVDANLGIIVHSQAAKQIIQAYSQKRSDPVRSAVTEITVIPHLMPMLDLTDHCAERVEWNLPEDTFVFGVAGTIHPSKEPHLVLRAFAQLARVNPHARLVFAGELPIDYGLPALVQELGLGEHVVFLGRLEPLERLHHAMAACDVLINLRRPTIGETSGTALRAMALGRPLIVRDVGWYSELPDTACCKIGAAAGADELASVMLQLAASPDMRCRVGESARRYIATECAPSVVARRYAEFLWSVYERITRTLGRRSC